MSIIRFMENPSSAKSTEFQLEAHLQCPAHMEKPTTERNQYLTTLHNFDAAGANGGDRGAGAVIRDHQGAILAVATWKIHGVLSFGQGGRGTLLFSGTEISNRGVFFYVVV
ncbi:uncharacterized protein DS421_12g372430 [Arachis hypogaea]|nr:uncharacterized protein DS421_12g372430 [Arachis hypogaea]